MTSHCVVCLQTLHEPPAIECVTCHLVMDQRCYQEMLDYPAFRRGCFVCQAKWPTEVVSPWLAWRQEWLALSDCEFDLCPQCGVAIQNTGECSQMQCLVCGHCFTFRERNQDSRVESTSTTLSSLSWLIGMHVLMYLTQAMQ